MTSLNRVVSIQMLGRSVIPFWLVFGLAGFLLFTNLHRGDIAGYDDAVYAHEGKEMMRTGDWANVWLNGKLDFDKPPLFIWLEAISFRVLGVSDFAAKFPSALLGLLTVALVYLIVRELTDDQWLASLSTLVFASTQYFLKYAMHAMTDVPFTFLCTLAIWAYLKAQQQTLFYWLCGLAIGGAGLTRSILGLLMVGVIGLHILLCQRWNVLRSGHLWFGCVWALALPLMWFITQYHWYGEAFAQHHFSYTAENARSIDPQRGWHFFLGLGEYPILLVKLYWPWLPCLLGGVILLVQQLWGKTESDEWLSREALWLLLAWIVVVMLPFSLIQHKVLRYILPAFPAFAILSAWAIRRWLPERHLPLGFASACCLMGLSVLGMTFSTSHRLRATEVRAMAMLADQAATPSQPIFLYTNGPARWDYLHQIIWYTDRRAQMLMSTQQTLCELQQPATTTLIIDRNTYQYRLEPMLNDLEVLGQTTTLVCVQRKSLSLAMTATAKPSPRTTSCD